MRKKNLERERLRQFVENIDREKLEEELGEACRNYREFIKQFSLNGLISKREFNEPIASST